MNCSLATKYISVSLTCSNCRVLHCMDEIFSKPVSYKLFVNGTNLFCTEM